MIGAIVTGKTLAAIGAIGVRKVGSDEPIRVDDLVHLGSCTKAMTATMIGAVVEAGDLAWSSTIRDVFPNRAATLHAHFRTVTLAQLLTHRAGLPHDGPWWRLGIDRSTTDQRRELLVWALRHAPLTRPGTTYAYSNLGYVLAALMAEEVTGTAWEDLMRAHVFEPLEMASAGFGPPGGDGGDDQPWGHRVRGGRIEPVWWDNAPVIGPAASVHCSVPDWAKFAALHLRAAEGEARLLKPETFRALHTPPPEQDYASGWMVVERSWAGGRALTHNGSNQTWFATIWLAPLRDFATLVATNQGGDAADAACDAATEALIKYHLFARQQPRRRRR
jgi:CubicO group peptidase (beta-lactamase class C family)